MRSQHGKSRALLPILSLAAIALFPGCSDDGFGPDIPITNGKNPVEPVLISWELAVEPSFSELEAGETIQLRALLRDPESGMEREVVADWRSEDPKAAQVTADGLVEVYAAGAVRITAYLDEELNPDVTGPAEAEALIIVH